MSLSTPTESSPRPPGRPRRSHAVLPLAAIAQFMVTLDVSIINVALPEMRHALHMSVTGQQWVINAYTLTFAGFLMLGGRAADLFGRRRLFMIGLSVFTLFSMLGGLAQTGPELIAARAAQGIGGAILAPASLSLLTATFTEHHARRRALGIWSATAASGAAGGLLLGGILTDVLDWRWVLFVNVPVGIALLFIAWARLSEPVTQTTRSRLDVAGGIAVTAGIATLVYGIVGTNTHPWGSVHTIAILSAAVVILLLFLLIETRIASSPIVPLATFRRRSLSMANLLATSVGATIFGSYFFISLFLQQVKHYSPLQTGVAFLPIGLATLAAALCASRLVHRIGVRRQLVLAPVLTAGAVLWLSHLTSHSTYFGGLFAPLVLAGAGFGLTFVPMTIAATVGVPHSEAGLASGLINMSRQFGGALGLAAVATIAFSVAHAGLAHHDRLTVALAHGYTRAFLILGAVSASGALCGLLLGTGVGAPASARETRDIRGGRVLHEAEAVPAK